jgi:hypothetical protein
MQYSPYDPLRKYTSPLFDPLTMTAMTLGTLGGGSAATGGAMALGGIGSAISAASSLAGGGYAQEVAQMKQQAANFQAAQIRENAGGEIAAAQRQAFDVDQKTNMLRSSAVADAAAGGVNAGAGSAVTNQSGIVQRGRYQSSMDLWNGQNRATGLLNQARGVQYTGYMDALAGEEAKRASYLSAMSTIAGGGASMMRMYGGSAPGGGQMTWTDMGTGGVSYPMFT